MPNPGTDHPALEGTGRHFYDLTRLSTRLRRGQASEFLGQANGRVNHFAYLITIASIFRRKRWKVSPSAEQFLDKVSSRLCLLSLSDAGLDNRIPVAFSGFDWDEIASMTTGAARTAEFFLDAEGLMDYEEDENEGHAQCRNVDERVWEFRLKLFGISLKDFNMARDYVTCDTGSYIGSESMNGWAESGEDFTLTWSVENVEFLARDVRYFTKYIEAFYRMADTLDSDERANELVKEWNTCPLTLMPT